MTELQEPIIAGGFVRAYYAGETPNDMDIYFRNSDDYKLALDRFKNNYPSVWSIVSDTSRAVTLTNNEGHAIQLINFVHGRPEELILRFDFTICSAALTINSEGTVPVGTVYLHDDFFEHLAGRVLIYNNSPLPLASLKRMLKYISRGYHICDENLIKIVEDISRLVNFDDQESLSTHILGMDPNGDRRVRVID